MKTSSIAKTVQIENLSQLTSNAIAALLSASRYAVGPANDVTPAQALRDFFIACAVHADMAAGGDSTAARYETLQSFNIVGLTRIENCPDLFISCALVMVSAKRADGSTSATDLRHFFMECSYWADAIARGDDYADRYAIAALHAYGETKPQAAPTQQQ